jgi:hypothetical protein
MGRDIPVNSTVEKFLDLLNIKNYRHPYKDHGSKKLLTVSTIMPLVEGSFKTV